MVAVNISYGRGEPTTMAVPVNNYHWTIDEHSSHDGRPTGVQVER